MRRFRTARGGGAAVAGVWVLAQLAEPAGGPGSAAAIVVAALQLLLGIGSSVPVLAQTKNTLTAAARVHEVAEKEIPSGSSNHFFP